LTGTLFAGQINRYNLDSVFVSDGPQCLQSTNCQKVEFG